MKTRGRFWGIVVCVFLAGGISLAQVTTGTIMGTVSDSTGAVIPGATVTIRNVDTGITRTAATDAAGRYRQPQLGLGNYEITAESTGFQSIVRSGVTLTVGREATVDFMLQVGAVAERITVTGEAPLVETTNATVSSLVDQGAMRDLPLNGRSIMDLTGIQPGVISDMPVSATGFKAIWSGGGGAARRSIGGTSPQQSTYLLDGLEISTASEGMPVNSVLGEQLGVEAIREFTLLQSNFGAQFGRAAGGVVNAVTQSGTNEFHGSVFEFVRNDKLDARDYFLDPEFDKNPLKRNQFGAAVGGPIQKDKTFFFMNYEGVRQAAGETTLSTQMTPETRLGNITGCPSGMATCTQDQRRILRTIKVNPAIVPLMAAKRLPNGDFRGTGMGESLVVSPWSAKENYGIARFDQQLSQNDNLFGRLTIDRSDRSDKLDLLLPDEFRSFMTGGYIIAAISTTHIFSPTVLNTFRVGYTRRNDHLFYNYTQEGKYFPQGHPDLHPNWSPVTGAPMGRWGVPGGGYGGTLDLQGPGFFLDNIFDYDDSLIISKGNHYITLGGDLRWYRGMVNYENSRYGSFSWGSPSPDRFLTNNPTVNGSQDQVLGFTIPGTQLADTYRGWRQNYQALYFQDDFRVLPNLTLNLGVRWETISGAREVNGKLAFVDDYFTAKDLRSATSKDERLFDLRKALAGISPRFGFAWTPLGGGKTVLRGGLGVFPEMIMQMYYQENVDAPPYSRRYRLDNTTIKPVFPFPFGDPAVLAAGALGTQPKGIDYNIKNPYLVQWNVSVEQQLSSNFVMKLNYMGYRGINQILTSNPNQAKVIIQNGRYYTPSATDLPNPNFASFRRSLNRSDRWYNAGQLVVDKRFSGGYRFNSSYTWSKNLDTGGGSGIKGGEGIAGTSGYTGYNYYDLAADKGLSNLHIPHNFTFSSTYELPFGTGRRWGNQWNGVVDRLLGGWTLSGTLVWRSGLVVNAGGYSRRSRCSTLCGERPDLKPGGDNTAPVANRTIDQWFDPTQFVMQPAGYFGNNARNTLTRPSLTNLNVSFGKDIRITEGKNLDFRAEFFNFLNHPNFGAPSDDIFENSAGSYDPTAGQITSLANAMRVIQLGLKFTF